MQNHNQDNSNLLLNNNNDFINVIVKVIKKLVDRHTGSERANDKYTHINIELMENKTFNSIQLTYCGQLASNCSIVLDILKELVYEIGDQSTIISYKATKNDYELIYDLHQLENNPIASKTIHFPYLKEYLSIQVKHTLTKREIKQFIDTLIEQLLLLQNQYSNVKYTFYDTEGKLLYINLVEFDHIYENCQLLASSITEILRLSMNDKFREKCFELLNIDHSEMANDAVTSTLLSLFNDNYQL